MKSVKNVLRLDYEKYYRAKPSPLRALKLLFTKDVTLMRWKYIKYMRLCDAREYNCNIFNNIAKMYFQRKKNRLGLRFGYEINSKNIAPGLLLYHSGPIVINGRATIGANCSLHGDNCIGNNGLNDECPIIGDNVDIGVGAKIIGKVRIADNVLIGAGSVVVSNIDKDGAVVVGVPGRIVKNKGDK